MQLRLQPAARACFALLPIALVLAPACGGSVNSGGSGGAGSTSSTTDTTSSTNSTTASTGTGSGACPTTSMTDLPGVHIEIDASQCTFSFSDPVQTISIDYQVVVDADVASVIPRAQD